MGESMAEDETTDSDSQEGDCGWESWSDERQVEVVREELLSDDLGR